MTLPNDTEGSRPPVDGLVVHDAYPHWGMAEFGPCLIVVWRGNVTEEALRKIGERISLLAAQRPGHCTYLNVIERNSPPPTPPLRKIAMADIARPGKALTCIGAVIEGNEFRAALVRAIMTGMTLLRPAGQPAKFFKTVQEMSRWVQGQLPDVANLDGQIVLAVEFLRAQLPKA